METGSGSLYFSNWSMATVKVDPQSDDGPSTSTASKLVREDIIELKQKMEQFSEDVRNSVDLIKTDLHEVCKEAQYSVLSCITLVC